MAHLRCLWSVCSPTNACRSCAHFIILYHDHLVSTFELLNDSTSLSKSSKPSTAPTAGRIKDCAKKIIRPDECLCRQDARGKNATAAKHCVINITSNIINVWLSDEQRSTCANLKAYVRAKDIETHGLLVLDVFELPSHSVSTLQARTLRIFTPTAWPSAPWSLATSCII